MSAAELISPSLLGAHVHFAPDFLFEAELPVGSVALKWTIVACVAICLLTDLVSRLATQTYAKLPVIDKGNWCIGAVRGTMGIVLAAASVPVYYCETLSANPAMGTTAYSDAVTGVLSGFFWFEMLTLVLMSALLGYKNTPLWFHHVLGLIFVESVRLCGALHFFALTSCVQELSAPFTTVSWMLAKAGYRYTWGFIANHAALVAVWVVFRIGNDFHRAYYVWSDFRALVTLVPWLPLVTFVLGSLQLMLFLNPHWLKMKSGQLARAIIAKMDGKEGAGGNGDAVAGGNGDSKSQVKQD
jgi:hypothetical protein